MPFSYKPSSEITREVLERIAKGIERQNELLEKLVPSETPAKKGNKK